MFDLLLFSGLTLMHKTRAIREHVCGQFHNVRHTIKRLRLLILGISTVHASRQPSVVLQLGFGWVTIMQYTAEKLASWQCRVLLEGKLTGTS